MIRTHRFPLLLSIAALSGCNPAPSQQTQTNAPTIKVRGPEQDRLHQLKAFDLAIALKRAIYDAGFICKRVTDGGFIGAYQNMDMWLAKCSEGRDWAVFAGPDGSAQVRDCKDVAATGLPPCLVKQRPEGSFTELEAGPAVTRAIPNPP